MSPRCGFKRTFVALVILIIGGPLSAGEAAHAGPEELFLVNALAHLYASLPAQDMPSDEFEDRLMQLRTDTLRYLRRLQEKGSSLDPLLLSSYEGFSQTLDAYVELMIAIQKIQAVAKSRQREESVGTLSSAAGSGFSVGMKLTSSGVPIEASAGIGAVVSLAHLLVGSYLQQAELNEERERQIKELWLRFENRLLKNRLLAEENAIALGVRRGWSRTEVSFNLPAVTEHDLTVALVNRPRDPIMLATLCWLRNEKRTPLDPTACMKAVDLVPEGPYYDHLRGAYGALAGDVLNRAFSVELGSKGSPLYSGVINSAANKAVRYWDLCVRYTDDAGGECRERKAWAVGANGQVKLALKLAQEVEPLRQNTERYELQVAALASQLGQFTLALAHLKKLVSIKGYSDIATLKASPDLLPLRRERAKEFAELVDVKWSWGIDYGILVDDIVITNESKFSLTNVVLIPDLPAIKLELKVDQLASGASYRWRNVVSVSQQATKDAVAEIKCDQLSK